jgi:site-specific DNA-methyltransferase (adenine-specific)
MKLINTLSEHNIHLFLGDSLDYYLGWDSPTVIISDGPYGIGGFPGDPHSSGELQAWYEPHFDIWSQLSKPQTTLWFWNTEQGWASLHNTLIKKGWDFVNCHIWDKGKAHIAGNTNTKTLRKLPVVTEVCAQYVRRAEIIVKGNQMSLQEWLRYEWGRTGIPFSKTNEACGVKNAATRKYFTNCHLWYFPPSEAFMRIVEYANSFGLKEGLPYFSVDGKNPLTKEEWEKMRSKFKCPFGLTNVWRQTPLNGKERLKNGSKALHLNQKPINLIRQIIEMSSEEGDVIWEPFGGLFTGALSASFLHRKAYAAEINSDVFQQGMARLKDEILSNNIFK